MCYFTTSLLAFCSLVMGNLEITVCIVQGLYGKLRTHASEQALASKGCNDTLGGVSQHVHNRGKFNHYRQNPSWKQMVVLP